MAKTKKFQISAPSKPTLWMTLFLAGLAVVMTVVFILNAGNSVRGNFREIHALTQGVDAARYQGTVDWAEAAQGGVEFAMIRVGYRTMTDGVITEDSNARYNLQEASKAGIRLGVYFFSTAVTEEEAREEAAWVVDLIADYPITYPVAYDCEGFRDEENRHAHLSVTERTDIALAFMKAIERAGYEAMFYAAKNDMENEAFWEMSRIEEDYKVWVAQYPEVPYPETEVSDYSRVHHMWQYTQEGTVPGFSGPVDQNVAYFGYDGTANPMNHAQPETVGPDIEAMMDFREVFQYVTAKDEVNLRDMPSQDTIAQVLYTLPNGEIVTRTGISDSGWSRLEWNGQVCYAVSSYLTTDLTPPPTEDPRVETVFRDVEDRVTAKQAVNLRTLPSTTDPESQVVVKLKHGDEVVRTGVNDDVGWSRVVYRGRILYCITRYLEVVEE